MSVVVRTRVATKPPTSDPAGTAVADRAQPDSTLALRPARPVRLWFDDREVVRPPDGGCAPWLWFDVIWFLPWISIVGPFVSGPDRRGPVG
ncbi:MAG: hypothetical protein DWQ36_11190 [Acidobacteria bacterium]|nr:MAG: hypothetical protein DWQ30_12210 [Acidobacteriota bacterium]REK07774.1 MAG: hypothetical protein DWQ36_11190 [Acidobacteriota bacterium]